MSFFNLTNSSKNQTPQSAVRGFTLIELMVCISIITIVSSVILVRNNSFNGAVLLRNQSYELAFAIRQAQLLAVSGTDQTLGDSRQYGVFFDKNKPQEYLIFRDVNNDGRYISANDEQIGPTGRLDSRFEIRGITNKDGFSRTPSTFSVTFIRPNFDSKFKSSTGGYLTDGAVYIDVAQVGKVGKGTGTVRRVEVTTTGQVGVTKYPDVLP